MLNILGGSDPDSYLRLADAADSLGAKVHLYGKGKATKGRKMGHLTILGDTMEEVERDVEPLISIADSIRNGRPISNLSDVKHETRSEAKPLISITTGSISDQPKLSDCYSTLDSLAIPYEKRITSVSLPSTLPTLPALPLPQLTPELTTGASHTTSDGQVRRGSQLARYQGHHCCRRGCRASSWHGCRICADNPGCRTAD